MLRKFLTAILCILMVLVTDCPYWECFATAQSFSLEQLPAPGTLLALSPPFEPVLIKGLKIHPENPFLFDFIFENNSRLTQPELKAECDKVLKYFLAGLTIPENDWWVNLSPYEKNRIISDKLGQTELGRDMLAEDYVLKQLSASLIYPENGLGKEFWSKVYLRSLRVLGSTDKPVNTFNKVWIMPGQSQVYETGHAVYVTRAKLKVMMDEDYLAMNRHHAISSISSPIYRQIVIPQLEEEVNNNKNFAVLRQIYNALILAKWYKESVQNSIVQKVYADKNKISGVDVDNNLKSQIYARYLQAYKKGVFNYIKQENPDGQLISRKYFSGGEIWQMKLDRFGKQVDVKSDNAMMLRVELIKSKDTAIVTQQKSTEGEIRFINDFKPGLQITVYTLNPKILNPHLVVNAAVEGKLFPINRKTNMVFYKDQQNVFSGDKDVRAQIPPVSKTINNLIDNNPGFEVQAVSSNENLFYNKPIVVLQNHRAYFARGEDIESLDYPMLVVWPDFHVTMEKHVRLKFTDKEKKLVRITIDGKEVDLRYATAVQLIKDKNGFVNPGTQIPFYDDVRHLFALPKFSFKDYFQVDRLLKGHDIFFMADQLLANNGALIKEHFQEPNKFQKFSLELMVPLSVDGKVFIYKISPQELRSRLYRLGYTAKDFKIDALNRQLFIHLKENVYPFHIIGVTPQGEVKEIVMSGSSGQKGLTLQEAARLAEHEGLEMAGILDQGTSIHLDINGKTYGNSLVDKGDSEGSRATSLIVYLKKITKTMVPLGLPLSSLNDPQVLHVFREIVRRRYDVRVLSEVFHLGKVPTLVTHRVDGKWQKLTPAEHADELVNFLFEHRREDPYYVARLGREKFGAMAQPWEFNEIFDNYKAVKPQIFDFQVIKDVLRKNSVVADIGAGENLLGQEILKYSDEHGLGIRTVIGTDISDFINQPESDRRLKFMAQGSDVTIPIPTGSVDTVIIKWVTHHVNGKDLMEFLKSVLRILKPGGKLIIFDALLSPHDDVLIHSGFNQELNNPITWPKGSFYGDNLKLSRDYMQLCQEQQRQVLALEDYFGHNLIMERNYMPQPFNYLSVGDFENTMSRLGMQEDLSLRRIYGSAPIIRMGPPSLRMVFRKKATLPFYVPGDGGENPILMLRIKDPVERSNIEMALHVLNSKDFSKSELEFFSKAIRFRDILLVVNDRIDTLAESLLLLNADVSKRIVILGRMETVPLIDKFIRWGYTINTPHGLVDNLAKWEKLKASIGVGLDQDAIENSFTGNSAEIIRQIMLQMVQNHKEDFPHLFIQNQQNKLKERLWAMKNSSTETFEAYRRMIKKENNLNRKNNIVFIASPLAQLRSKILLEEVFYRELNRRRIEFLSHTVSFDNMRYSRKDVINGIIKNAWQTVVDVYSKREKIPELSEHHYLDQIDKIEPEFWEALIYLIGRLDRLSRYQLARELCGATPEMLISQLLNSPNKGIIGFVKALKMAADGAMMGKQDLQNGGIDFNHIVLSRVKTLKSNSIEDVNIRSFLQSGFDGFSPLIVRMTPVQNLLGSLKD